MRVFVTGATGVVGRRLVPLLRAAKHEVTAAARSPQRRQQLERTGASVVEVDLFDAPAVGRALLGHDAVINLATHIPHSTTQMFLPWAWRENDRVRRVASQVLVQASIAARVLRFVQESFAPVYPDRGDWWIDETTPIEPSRYNRTIADAEAAALGFGRTHGAAVVLRFGSFYGPDALQVEAMTTWIKRGWAPLPGPPTAYISSVSHDDAASAAAAALLLPSGVYNVVDDDPVTHREYVDTLAEAIGVPHPRLPPPWITPLFGSPGEMLARSVRVSNQKLRVASGWSPEFPSVREGWAAAVGRVAESPHRSEQLTA